MFTFAAKAQSAPMTRSSYFFTLLLCFSVLACGENADQSDSVHLNANYYVRYLAATQQLKAEAQFTDGLEPQSARSKRISGGVRFQGNPMEMQTLKEQQYRYIYTDTMDFASEIYFQYGENADLNREELVMTPIDYYRTMGPAEKATGLTLVTRQHLLKGNESLVVLLADRRNRAASHTIQGPSPDSIHQIPPGVFQDLESGPGSLYLVKRMKKTREQARQTITATLEYYTDTLRVEIRD